MATDNIFSGTITCTGITNSGSTSLSGAVTITGRATTTDGVSLGTARVIGGRAFSTLSDSVALSQAGGIYLSFGQTYSIPASTLKAASVLKIRAVVRITTVLNAGATFSTRLMLGGTSLVTSPQSTAGAAGTRCFIDSVLTFRDAPGAAIQASGVSTAIWTDTVGVVTTSPGAAAAVPTFATNAALVVDVQGVSSAAGDGSGRIVLEQLYVEII